MPSIERKPSPRRLLARAALALGVLGALVGAASAVAAPQGLPLVYSKPVCPTAAAGHARCLAYVVTTRAGVPKVSLQSVSGYGPARFQTAYGPTAAAQAQTNEVVAIVDAYDNPNAKSDLDTYSTNFGLPILPTCTGQSNAGCFRKVNQTGGTTPPTGDTGWGLEI